jgi:hypothetical protein
MVFDSSVRHLCLGGQGIPHRRRQARGGITQNSRVPYDRVQVAGIEMRLGSVPFLLTASVDDRAAQTFGESSFPIGAIVVMEIGDHES